MTLHGFAVLFQPVNFRFLLLGLAVTGQIAFWTIIFSFIFGTILGVLRFTGRPVLGRVATTYIEVVRNLPMLLFIMVAYVYSHLPGAWAGVLGMTVFTSSIIAEIVRGGLVSVDRGQWEASRSQGFNMVQILWHIVLPQALRRMIPPLISQFITVVKDTSFVWMVGVEEITGKGVILFGKYQNPLETFTTIACIYFLINYAMSIISRRLERQLAVRSF